MALSTPLLTDDRPVFVGGCPRSGTTLLSAMLSAHPALAIPPETRFFLEGYRARRRFGDLTLEANRRAFGQWVTSSDSTRFALLQLPADEVIEAVAAAPPTIGSLTGAVLQVFARSHGAQRWGDKRPLFVEELDTVFRLVPDAQFIHIIRDARGCTASLKRLGWWGWGAPEALHKWKRSVTAGLRARRTYRPDQYLELRYEDLVVLPEEQLRRVCSFLGLDFDTAMLQHEKGAALIQQPYHARLSQPLDPSVMEQWRNHLTPQELALVEDRAGHLLDELGYPRMTQLPEVPAWLRRRYVTAAARRNAATAGVHALDAIRRARPEPPVAARLTTAQRQLAQR